MEDVVTFVARAMTTSDSDSGHVRALHEGVVVQRDHRRAISMPSRGQLTKPTGWGQLTRAVLSLDEHTTQCLRNSDKSCAILQILALRQPWLFGGEIRKPGFEVLGRQVGWQLRG